jgi:hypothetical protein
MFHLTRLLASPSAFYQNQMIRVVSKKNIAGKNVATEAPYLRSGNEKKHIIRLGVTSKILNIFYCKHENILNNVL